LKLLFILFIIIIESSIALSNNEFKKVSLQLKWLDQYEFAGYYIAKEKGFYKKYNLELEIKKFNSNIDIVQNVISQNADFGISSSSLIIEKSKGKDILLLSSIFQSSPLVLLSLKEKNITDVKDLKNKRVMFANDQENFATIQTMLKSGNIKIEDIKPILHSFDVNDLIKNNTDLMTAYTTNEPIILDKLGIQYNILNPKDYGFDYYEDILFTTSQFYKENPIVVRNFKKATIEGWKYAFENIDETAKLIYEKYNGQNKSLEAIKEEAYAMQKLIFDENNNIGTINKDRIKLIANSYLLLNMMKSNIDIDSLVLEENKIFNKTEEKYIKNKKFVTFCVDPDYYPFSKLSNNKLEGISKDFVDSLRNIIKIPFKLIQTENWSESLNLSKSRTCDILIAAMQTESRNKYLNFTKPIIKSSLVLVTKVDKPYFENFENVLENKKIGLIKNFAHTEILQKKYKNADFVIIDNLEEGYKKITDNTIYGLVDSIHISSHNIQEKYLGDLKISSKLKMDLELSIAVRNDDKELFHIINTALDNISEDEKKFIFNKWSRINIMKNDSLTIIVKAIIAILIITTIFILFIRREKKLNLKFKKLNHQLNKKNKELDEMINIKSKQATFGSMIDSISHQWKQPLNELALQLMDLELEMELEKKVPSEKRIKTVIDNSNNILKFMSDTINIFRNFYVTKKEKEIINLSETISNLIMFFKVTFDNLNINFHKEIKKNLYYECIENEFMHSILNIIVNSKDALLRNNIKNGIITIKLYDDEVFIYLEVEDNAQGIKITPIDSIFESNISSKKKNGGIGLYLTKNIIEDKMNGSVEVQNINEGCRFTIKLRKVRNG
jgi:ABC-type nitrate/sulfonate/bicarbonate transport system substrate-binding protein/signal transduction histidine kinase